MHVAVYLDVLHHCRAVCFKAAVEVVEVVYAAHPSEVDMASLLEAARLAPSACNRQPWRFMVIGPDDTAGREAVLASYPREWLATAPYYIVVCGVPAEAWVRPHDGHNHIDIDIAIATEHICLQASTSEGAAEEYERQEKRLDIMSVSVKKPQDSRRNTYKTVKRSSAAYLIAPLLLSAACNSAGCLDNQSAVPLARFYSSATRVLPLCGKISVCGWNPRSLSENRVSPRSR